MMEFFYPALDDIATIPCHIIKWHDDNDPGNKAVSNSTLATAVKGCRTSGFTHGFGVSFQEICLLPEKSCHIDVAIEVSEISNKKSVASETFNNDLTNHKDWDTIHQLVVAYDAFNLVHPEENYSGEFHLYIAQHSSDPPIPEIDNIMFDTFCDYKTQIEIEFPDWKTSYRTSDIPPCAPR